MKVEWDHVCRLISACTEQGLHRPGGDQLPHPLGLTLVPREASTWSHSLLVTWPQALLSVCVCVCVCVYVQAGRATSLCSADPGPRGAVTGSWQKKGALVIEKGHCLPEYTSLGLPKALSSTFPTTTTSVGGTSD